MEDADFMYVAGVLFRRRVEDKEASIWRDPACETVQIEVQQVPCELVPISGQKGVRKFVCGS